MRSRFIMITGVGPGIGKSTLAEGLAVRAHALGKPFDLFGEEQIFTRPAFTEIGRAEGPGVRRIADLSRSKGRSRVRRRRR